jgi:hypothetical protein
MPFLLLSLNSDASVSNDTYLSIVNFLMLFQIVFSVEASLTYITLIRLFSGMTLHMVVQTVPVFETHFTIQILANISNFLIVPPLVS